MKKLLKRTISVLLLTLLILSFSACKSKTTNKVDRFEGDGYETADEAAIAYAEALCQANIDDMLSSFAVETFVENCDLKELVKSRKFYQYDYAECPFENSGDFQTQINYYSRQFDLVNDFKQLYFYLVLGDDDHTTTEIFLKNDSAEIDSFINKISDPSFKQKMSKARVRRVLTPEMLKDIDLLTYKNSTTVKYSYLKCDNITSFAIEFDFNDKGYYLFVDVGCFDGVWYNISASSSLGICAGADGNYSIMLDD